MVRPSPSRHNCRSLWGAHSPRDSSMQPPRLVPPRWNRWHVCLPAGQAVPAAYLPAGCSAARSVRLRPPQTCRPSGCPPCRRRGCRTRGRRMRLPWRCVLPATSPSTRGALPGMGCRPSSASCRRWHCTGSCSCLRLHWCRPSRTSIPSWGGRQSCWSALTRGSLRCSTGCSRSSCW